MNQIHYKQGEKFEYEFFADKECTQKFKFSKSDENLYIELERGNVTPILALSRQYHAQYEKMPDFTFYTPFTLFDNYKTKTLKDIAPNYSKYIPKDCAVVFLDEEDLRGYKDCFPERHIGLYIDDGEVKQTFTANNTASLVSGIEGIRQNKKVILFAPELTSSSINQIKDITKKLKEEYGIKWVSVFSPLCYAWFDLLLDDLYNINQLITTNATGVLEPMKGERLEVIDCKEIFETTIIK